MWSLSGVLRSRRVKEWVFWEVEIMGKTLGVRVPERLVPDAFEGKAVRLEGDFDLDKNGKPVLRVKIIKENSGAANEG